MGVFLRFMGSPNCKDLKNAMEEVNFWGTWFTEKKTQKRCESGTSKINFPHSILQIFAIRTCHEPYKHPHAKGWLSNWWKSWEKNFEKKFFLRYFFFQNFFLRIFIISTTNPWHGGVYKVHGKSRLQGFVKCYGGS